MARHTLSLATIGALATVSVVLLAIGARAEASYMFTTIDYPGASSSEANGINAAGDIVGDYTDARGSIHALWLSS